MPVASPPRLVVSGFYRYVRNPIYVGFVAILVGEVLLFGSSGLVEYTAVAWGVAAAAVRLYEEPHSCPQVRSRLSGVPARRTCLDSPAAPLDTR